MSPLRPKIEMSSNSFSNTFPSTVTTVEIGLPLSKQSLQVETAPSSNIQEERVCVAEIIKVMDLPVIVTCLFTPEGRVCVVTEQYDVMQVLFDKERLKASTSHRHLI